MIRIYIDRKRAAEGLPPIVVERDEDYHTHTEHGRAVHIHGPSTVQWNPLAVEPPAVWIESPARVTVIP